MINDPCYRFSVRDDTSYRCGCGDGSGSGSGSGLPEVTTDDNGKTLVVQNGSWIVGNVSGGGGGVQSDWNEDDATSPAYIQNRICYEEPSNELSVILSLNDRSPLVLTDPDVFGQTMVVYSMPYNGPEPITEGGPYEFIVGSQTFSDVMLFPSPEQYNALTNDYDTDGMLFTYDGSTHNMRVYVPGNALTSADITIKKQLPEVHTIPTKYVDYSVIPIKRYYSTAFGTFISGASIEGFIDDADDTNIASGGNSHAEGGDYRYTYDGDGDILETFKNITKATGQASHAEGGGTTASGQDSHAEGRDTTASNQASHSEGLSTIASGGMAHAEGTHTTASGDSAHAEGYYTNATQSCAHAEGTSTTASGMDSHAEGHQTHASGWQSHTEGYGTNAPSMCQHVFGRYNAYETGSEYHGDNSYGTYVELVGNGRNNLGTITRSNARTLDWSGNEKLAGSITLGMGTADETTITAAQLKALLALLN